MAAGSAPLAYQWQLDMAIIPGATGPVLALSGPALKPGNYRVVASNPVGTATSSAARLAVQAGIATACFPPEAGYATGGGTVELGMDLALEAHANSGFDFVNWTENGSVHSTSASFTITVTTNRNVTANFNRSHPPAR